MLKSFRLSLARQFQAELLLVSFSRIGNILNLLECGIGQFQWIDILSLGTWLNRWNLYWTYSHEATKIIALANVSLY